MNENMVDSNDSEIVKKIDSKREWNYREIIIIRNNIISIRRVVAMNNSDIVEGIMSKYNRK